jgi:hypothetical protein
MSRRGAMGTPPVIPAKAGIQTAVGAARQHWIPAFAGMTGLAV